MSSGRGRTRLMSPDLERAKGKINRVVGEVTGDRKQEAIGTVQEREGHDPDTAEVNDATKKVKQDHHDYGDRTPPQEVPHSDR